MKVGAETEMTRSFSIEIPADLKWLDEDCHLWARVVRDPGPAPCENAIYRAMRLYGDATKWRPQDEEPPAPLSAEQVARGWEIDEAVKRMPWLYRNALVAWYVVPLSNPRWIARRMRITVKELGQRLVGALNLLDAMLKRGAAVDPKN